MTNWPNIQEYRNFEAKFFDNPKHNETFNSAAQNEFETLIKEEFKNNDSENFLNSAKINNVESKTVRCVIRKDFEEAFKKLDRGDGIIVNYESFRQKTQELGVDQTAVNKIRLQNHLKWKKQKEEEYFQKKEAERIAQQKKKEEEILSEKLKKQKEKEREEKIKEWQEQKAREKEEKKKEKMIMKMLEVELKEATPSIDKEKLIEEWVKLKNKQKQMEAEKKAEILKKKEESRAVRQNLAKLSYMQWKERIKGRMMTLPKNGYQFFGPKPIPVVKEDWNHDFINDSPRNQGITLKSIKSNTNTSLTFRPPIKELQDLSNDIFYLGDIKSKNHLKATKSGLSLYNSNETFKEKFDMPLKELQPGTLDFKKSSCKNSNSCFSYNSQEMSGKTKIAVKKEEKSFASKSLICDTNYLSDFYDSAESNQNTCTLTQLLEKPNCLQNSFGAQILPNKNKIELYINACSKDQEEITEGQNNFEIKGTHKAKEFKTQKDVKKDIMKNEKCNEQKKKTFIKEKYPDQKLIAEEKIIKKNSKELKKCTKPETAKGKICRRSRSYDKPVKKGFKNREKTETCLLSRSMVKIPRPSSEIMKSLNFSKSAGSCNQKRKSRQTSKPNTPESINKKGRKRTESEVKTKKPKRKTSLSKSFSFSDSPYCVKKTISKNLGKVKGNASRKNDNTKKDKTGFGRITSTTRI